MTLAKVAPDVAPETVLEDAVIGIGLLAGAANIIMQLSLPAVGYGVYESRVESGRVFDHPVKRSRTTFTYLSVAIMGTDEERKRYRQAVNKAHAQVFSTEESPVEYHGMDPGLQLWVAACLYRGFEDTYELLVRPLEPHERASVYAESARLGTTLQVRESMWPADREAFEEYWNSMLDQVLIDDRLRHHLLAIAKLRMFPRPVSLLLGRFNLFVTTGFLPERFRQEMRLSWSPRKQARFERLMKANGAIATRLPRILREFPYNLCLWDLRRRLKRGLPLI